MTRTIYGIISGIALTLSGAEAMEPCLVLTDQPSAQLPLLATVREVCPGGVDILDVADQSVHLFKFGQPIYSNLLLVLHDGGNFKFLLPDDSYLQPESIKFRPLPEDVQTAKLQEIKRPGLPGLSQTELTSFIDFGGNIVVLVQGGSGVSTDLESLLSLFGMTLYGSSLVKDFFAQTTTTSGAIKGEPWIELITGSRSVPISKVSPIGLNPDNRNVLPVLRASPMAFHDTAPSQGPALTLAAANQGNNGARFTLIGSLDIEPIARELFTWGFGRRALIRARDLYHHRVGEKEPPRMYREKDQIEVGVVIEELRDGKWLPYPASDVQLEYVMLDPYIRETMKFTGIDHKLVITAPDVYGIFKFRIDYKRKGYNPIKLEQVAPVRNMRHNDYERFLFCAYPYYISCFVTLGLVFFFALFFINHKESGKRFVEKEARHRE